MDQPASPLNVPLHLDDQALAERMTEIFDQLDEGKPVACPYCAKQFRNLGGQASHVRQTKCRLQAQARLAARTARQSLEARLSPSCDSGRPLKRTRFVEGDVAMVVEGAEQARELASGTTHDEPTLTTNQYSRARPNSTRNRHHRPSVLRTTCQQPTANRYSRARPSHRCHQPPTHACRPLSVSSRTTGA